ncbi:MAG: KpsF/GutQ family sugar-phosphate isomerase [Pseudomonadota bacterium]
MAEISISQTVQDCLEIAQNSLAALKDAYAVDAQALEEAVSVISACQGRVVVSGMGKSGIIGRKLVATFASTGTPSLFLHPAEASHGDLGMLNKGDVLILLSNSGESRELGDILRYAKRFSVPIIGMTAKAGSTLGQRADTVLLLPKVTESCPHNLAPTSSTLIQLALGDAIAIALLKLKGFSEEDFFNFHPGGKLGAALTPVSELMRPAADLPLLDKAALIADVLDEISKRGFGIAGLLDGEALVGVITDGDIRRYLAKNTEGSMKEIMFGTSAEAIMTAKFVAVEPEQSAAKVLATLEEHKISASFVVDGRTPVGLVRMLDLVQAGVA